MVFSLNPITYFLGKNTWDPRTLPDLSGRIYVVTGANRGMGFMNVKHLYFRNAKVYLGSRDEAKGKAAVAQLKHMRDKAMFEPNSDWIGDQGEVIWLPVDYSDAQAAKASAETLLALEDRLDVLINNAAILPDFSRPHEEHGQGKVPDQMMVNHIAPFVFIETLLPLLVKTAAFANSDVRIVLVSSNSHRMAPANDPSICYRVQDFYKQHLDQKYPHMGQYAVSKLANLLYGHALYARLTSNTKADDSGIPAANPPTIIFVHPGFVDTFSTDDRLPLKPIIGPLIRALVTQPEEGACTATFAAAASEASNPNYQGAYLIRGPRIVPQGEMEKNPNMVGKRREALQSEVWRSTMEYLDGVGVSFAETNAL